jgi:hypothetical protein
MRLLSIKITWKGEIKSIKYQRLVSISYWMESNPFVVPSLLCVSPTFLCLVLQFLRSQPPVGFVMTLYDKIVVLEIILIGLSDPKVFKSCYECQSWTVLVMITSEYFNYSIFKFNTWYLKRSREKVHRRQKRNRHTHESLGSLRPKWKRNKDRKMHATRKWSPL